jgi:hypothetical protein
VADNDEVPMLLEALKSEDKRGWPLTVHTTPTHQAHHLNQCNPQRNWTEPVKVSP